MMGDFLTGVGRAIWGVWTLDRSMSEWFGSYPNATLVALAVAMLAGMSTLLGNSVVLFLNRVRGVRFIVALLFNGFSMVGLYLVQALVVAGVGYLVTGEPVSLLIAVRGVMLSTAPMIFGVFVLMPYLGPGVARVLQAWGLLALWVIVGVGFGTDRWTALVITGAGWAIMQGLSWLGAKPLTKLANRVWRLVTGHQTMLTAEDLLSGHQFMPVEFTFEPPRPRGEQGGAQ